PDVVPAVESRRPSSVEHELAALVHSSVDVALDALTVRGRDDWSDHGVGLGRRADLEVRRRAHEPVDELVAQSAVHDGTRRRRADLSGVERPHRDERGDRLVDIGVVEDDARALPAEFEQEALHRRPAGFVYAYTNGCRP